MHTRSSYTRLIFFTLLITSLCSCLHSRERIGIVSVLPSENTGQDYSALLTDNLNVRVPDCWTRSNFKYVDVLLRFASTFKIADLDLYDMEGVFSDNPASIYAVNGDQKTLIGIFNGDQYKTFVKMSPALPVTADALIIHKYANNFPQKIKVYGYPVKDKLIPGARFTFPPVITLENLDNKTIGDPPFTLIARSTDTTGSLTFASSDTTKFAVLHEQGTWIGRIKDTGAVRLTVMQKGTGSGKEVDTAAVIYIRPKNTDSVRKGKIPIDGRRWIQLTNASTTLAKLFDGKTDSAVETGWGKIVPQYDSYYPVLNGEEIDLTGLRFFDGEGTNSDQPVTVSIITKDGQRINIGSFTGSQYNRWVGPRPAYPDSINLQTTFYNIKYIILNSWDHLPTEIEFYGNYFPGVPLLPTTTKSFPLNQQFGINGFEWNLENPSVPGSVDPKRLAAATTFSGLRHYLDWSKLEPEKDKFTFNPAFDGGWNYDAMYDSCRSAGIEVLACIKTVPTWLLNSYPADQRDNENVPVKYGDSFSNPVSYIEQAKVAFQYAARYGNNQAVNKNLLHVNTVPRWTGDVINVVKVGLHLVKYMECDNERDKWWKGRKAYQTAFEYAANLSAFYDGNKNTMGPGVGVKNADPEMQVVMAGTALATTDYVRGMIEWCRINRGYKPDGKVNLCWDVINYHYYSNDSKNSQNGKATRGSAPELSGAEGIAREFLNVAHQQANDIPVWITEIGYDVNQGSPFKAIPIGKKTALQTEADWILRSALLYSYSGIERIFFYEMIDDNPGNALQFSSSGLLNNDFTRRPASCFIKQVTNSFGNYRFAERLKADPVLDRYEYNGQSVYVTFVPDEKARTANLTVKIAGADSVKLLTPQYAGLEMNLQKLVVSNSSVTITATETPVFIVPFNKTSAPGSNGGDTTRNNTGWDNGVKVFPSPATDILYVTVNNDNNNKVAIRIVEAATGVVLQNTTVAKPSAALQQTFNIQGWPAGYYLVQVSQAGNKKIVKILKSKQ